MTWVRIDEDFPQHPKVLRAGPLSLAFHVAGLCYCNRYLTDGFVPESATATLLDLDHGDTVMVVGRLLEAGLWEQVERGYIIHDYLEYQPSKRRVMQERRKKQAAGKAGGKASAQARAKAPPQAKSNPGSVPVPTTVPESKTDTSEERARRKRQIPDNYQPPDELLEWARSDFPRLDVAAEVGKFADYHGSKGSTFVDWDKAWRNWIRRAEEYRTNGHAAYANAPPTDYEEASI